VVGGRIGQELIGAADGGGGDPPLRHFCATAYVYDPLAEKFLLIRHRKLRRWIPPGGHVEENELPAVAAVREVLEETGISVRLVAAPAPKFPGEITMDQPFAMRIYEIEPGHEHMTFLYVAIPTGGSLADGERGEGDVGWFFLEEIVSETFETFSDVRSWCQYFAACGAGRFGANRVGGILEDGK
jgi:8-oxo-dGTP pyrophosphatase MutT (NUDIX family)